GAAIAYTAAKAGIEVVLKDVELAAAEKGKAYAVKREESALAKGKTTEEKSKAVLDRITPSAAVEDFAGVDFVIEARSEERRAGKECRMQGWREDRKRKGACEYR